MEQIDFINKIVELKAANPDAEIKMCVSNELADDYGWTIHTIKRVELSPYIMIDDRVYTDNEDSVMEEICEMFYDGKMTDDELEAVAKKYYNENTITAICVYTEA